jgi:hypothetical protein
VLTNCAHVKCNDFKNDQNVELSVVKLDMVKLFPNLKTVTIDSNKIIYQREINILELLRYNHFIYCHFRCDKKVWSNKFVSNKNNF